MRSRSEKFWDNANTIYDRILMVFFLLVILIGVYITLDVIHVFRQANGDAGRFRPDVINADTLREISEDAVGWITLDGTSVDYPIMQARNNIEYLNKDPKGNYSLSGSIFMDFRCAPDFTDAYSLVYGHHMSGGMMFGALDAYKDEAYAKKHETGTLYTLKGKYPVKVLGYYVTRTDCDEIFRPGEEIQRTDYLKNKGVYYFTQNETENILALTTCMDPSTSDRTALLVSIVREK